MADYQIKLQRFLSNTYCDLFFLTILGNDTSTSYFFFGDMQKNCSLSQKICAKNLDFRIISCQTLSINGAERIVEPHLLKRFWNDINAQRWKREKIIMIYATKLPMHKGKGLDSMLWES